ncbi:MAG: fpgS [Firmicutes bacterium]|nr:fpgS [Bacillota bacterium]
MNYDQSLDYLETLATFGIKPGLTRIEKLLDLMGQPQLRYRTIHVTGTNGKGSTTAMLAAILKAAGIKTGMYTSPHLVSYTERFLIDGQSASEGEFAAALTETAHYVDAMVAEGEDQPTEFEVLTAAAFHYFAQKGVEWAVIEVGLGGLLDSTNVIIPQASVITNVMLDHTDRCGTTVKEIAFHKAGIIKPGVPVITAATEEALDVMIEKAAECRSPIYQKGLDFQAVRLGNQGMMQIIHVAAPGFEFSEVVKLPLIGVYQVENCANAVMTALCLRKNEPRITNSAIHAGLQNVVWFGRAEVLKKDPVIIIDGAHNPAGAKALRDTLNSVFPGRPITFLFGVLRDKDRHGIIKELISPLDAVVVVSPLSPRAMPATELAPEISASHIEIADTIAEGLERAGILAGADGVVCAAGSLYLIGVVRSLIVGVQE